MKILFYLSCILLLSSCDKSLFRSDTTSTNGTGGSLARFTLVGDYLYVIESGGLKTFDVTNPATPVLKNTLSIQNNIETIYPYKDNLFIGSQTGMFIYSLSDPANPAYMGAAQHVRSCDPVAANDTAAFVTLSAGTVCGAPVEGLYVYNIKNLLQPVLLTTLPFSSPYGLGIKDSTLFVCRGTDGLSVINIRNTSSPVILKTITGPNFKDVIPYNDLLHTML